MKKIIIWFVLTVLSTAVSAQTPFTLTGIKQLSVVAEDNSGLKLDKVFLGKLRKMMGDTLKKVGVKVVDYDNNILGLMIKSDSFGDVKLVTLNMILGGQVQREGESELVFGLTYQQSDTIKIEELYPDITDSLEFLLSEFSDQYIEDQKE